MAFEIRVAKSGENANSTDPNDFIFHSAYNTFKILAEGTLLTQTVNANPKTFTLAHGLEFVPTFYGFAKFPYGYIAPPNSMDFTNQAFVSDGYGTFSMEADDTNLYFIFTRPGSNYNVDIKYYVFEAPSV